MLTRRFRVIVVSVAAALTVAIVDPFVEEIAKYVSY